MFHQTWNPPNRYDGLDIDWEVPPPKARLSILEDDTRGILSHNQSPDIEFDWSVNPYRGCTHACAYCYARTFHEHLGYGAGSDFERRIVVKVRAPELLEAAFQARRWKGQLLAFSGATDCYQPLERRYTLTRRCLQVCAAFRNPVTIVTRSPLVTRDLDVLGALHEHGAVAVTISVPILDAEVARALEPGAPAPAHRLEAVRVLARAGIPVGVSIAPVIPGLSDRAVPATLQAAHEAGARWAWFSALRLPGAVEEVFRRRLHDALPMRAAAVWSKLRRLEPQPAHGRRLAGDLSSPAWATTRRLFELWHGRLGFGGRWYPPSPGPFRRPQEGRQMSLFASAEPHLGRQPS